jgi:hypothetical protein
VLHYVTDITRTLGFLSARPEGSTGEGTGCVPSSVTF